MTRTVELDEATAVRVDRWRAVQPGGMPLDEAVANLLNGVLSILEKDGERGRAKD